MIVGHQRGGDGLAQIRPIPYNLFSCSAFKTIDPIWHLGWRTTDCCVFGNELRECSRSSAVNP